MGGEVGSAGFAGEAGRAEVRTIVVRTGSSAAMAPESSSPREPGGGQPVVVVRCKIDRKTEAGGTRVRSRRALNYVEQSWLSTLVRAAVLPAPVLRREAEDLAQTTLARRGWHPAWERVSNADNRDAARPPDAASIRLARQSRRTLAPRRPSGTTPLEVLERPGEWARGAMPPPPGGTVASTPRIRALGSLTKPNRDARVVPGYFVQPSERQTAEALGAPPHREGAGSPALAPPSPPTTSSPLDSVRRDDLTPTSNVSGLVIERRSQLCTPRISRRGTSGERRWRRRLLVRLLLTAGVVTSVCRCLRR